MSEFKMCINDQEVILNKMTSTTTTKNANAETVY